MTHHAVIEPSLQHSGEQSLDASAKWDRASDPHWTAMDQHAVGPARRDSSQSQVCGWLGREVDSGWARSTSRSARPDLSRRGTVILRRQAGTAGIPAAVLGARKASWAANILQGHLSIGRVPVVEAVGVAEVNRRRGRVVGAVIEIVGVRHAIKGCRHGRSG